MELACELCGRSYPDDRDLGAGYRVCLACFERWLYWDDDGGFDVRGRIECPLQVVDGELHCPLAAAGEDFWCRQFCDIEEAEAGTWRAAIRRELALGIRR
jgi:hypothetical protein